MAEAIIQSLRALANKIESLGEGADEIIKKDKVRTWIVESRTSLMILEGSRLRFPGVAESRTSHMEESL